MCFINALWCFRETNVLWFDQKFIYILVAWYEREFYQHKYQYLSLFPAHYPLGCDGFGLECCHSSDTCYLHFLLGNQSAVFQLLTGLVEESFTFNFLLYSCTEVYCLSFRSGSLCYASWTQFCNPKREMHALFHWSLLLDSNFWQWWTWNHLSEHSNICKWFVNWSPLLLRLFLSMYQWKEAIPWAVGLLSLVPGFLISLLTLRSNQCCVIFLTLWTDSHLSVIALFWEAKKVS